MRARGTIKSRRFKIVTTAIIITASVIILNSFLTIQIFQVTDSVDSETDAILKPGDGVCLGTITG